MDEVLIKQLTRQLKILNIWVSIVGLTLLAAIAVCLYLLFKVYTFVESTQNRIGDLQEKTESSLNVQQRLCENRSITNLLENRSELCRQ